MTGNLILSILPAAEREWVASHSEPVRVKQRQLLHVAGEKISWHYFLVDCLIASYGVTAKGTTSEYALVGAEGYTGVSAVLGDARGIGNAMVLVGGSCTRASVPLVHEAFKRCAVLHKAMLRSASLRVFHMSQTSLCATHHGVEPRLARWLLQAFDRVSGPTLRLTHDMIGTALGVRREAVTLAARQLQLAGAISAARGRITLENRRRLESQACDCYVALSAELGQLITDFGAFSSSNGSQAKYTDGAWSSNRR
jgi:CRP-like cAMP-binding protein